MNRRVFIGIAGLIVVIGVVLQAQTALEKELMKIENDWCTAWVKKDKAALERLYATEYLSTNYEGATSTKAQDIASMVSPDMKFESFVLSDMKVHVYGEAAVVTGLNTVKSSYKGANTSGGYRFTDVFVKRDGRWQVVATQGSKVVAKK